MKFFNKISLVISLVLGSSLFVHAMEVPELNIAWGVSERQGVRPSMEDSYAYAKLQLTPYGKPAYYFGIFDGHGGAHSAKLAGKYAPSFFLTSFRENSPKIQKLNDLIAAAFDKSYVELDKAMQRDYQDGTTAVSALVWDTNVYLAWAGDSRAVVAAADGRIKAETTDHKPNNPTEKKRIEATGERIWVHPAAPKVYRVGDLASSRSLGDKQPKAIIAPNAVIPNPEMKRVTIQKGDIIILACDGLWDVMTSQEAVKFVRENLNKSVEDLQKINPVPLVSTTKGVESADNFKNEGNNNRLQEISRALRDAALLRDSRDNISVMIIQVQ